MSATLRTVRWIGLGLVVALLTSCGTTPSEKGSGAPAATASATAEPLDAERLVQALPDEAELPAGAVVSVRCPGDQPCTEDERQDQTASISMNLPLPKGVASDSTSLDDGAKYRVQGGEYEENLWLRAWFSDDAAAAQGLARGRKGLEELQGQLDTAPKKTDTGYTYGIQGKGTVEDLGIDGWDGYMRILDARFMHLDGRASDPRYDIVTMAQRGPVIVRIDASFTVEGQKQDDAEKVVRAQLERYLRALDEES